MTGERYQLFTIDGTVAGLTTVQAVVFYSLNAVDHAGRIMGCEREPHGSVAILTQEGHWFDLEFEGMDSEGSLDPDVGCDRCTTAWFEGHPLGEVCINADAAYDWSR